MFPCGVRCCCSGVDQYVNLRPARLKVNIEAETAETIARTMLLPAALRHLATIKAAGDGSVLAELAGETEEAIQELVFAMRKLDSANYHPEELEGLELARYIRDSVLPEMDGVREVADRLEKIVCDDLWPLPKYSEILFIK